MLDVNRLTKSYGPKRAIDAVSFTLHNGEVAGLLGRNGAGKTTTLSCVAGHLKPDFGTVSIRSAGKVHSGRELHGLLGFASQDIAVYPTLTAEQNIDFAARLGGKRRRATRSIAAELLNRFGLSGMGRSRVMTLSGGQQRLVHVACALAHQPEVLILDEPTAGLDIDARATLFDYLTSLSTEGVAVLISSHYVTEVEQHCGRVFVIDGGTVLADAPVADLIGAEGDTHVEVHVGELVKSIEGDDVQAALGTLTADERTQIRSINISRPSLEQVFIRLTGLQTRSEPALLEV